MSWWLERRVAAYRDGELSASRRVKLESQLESDSGASHLLRRSEALGRAVREAWTDGPSAPAPDRLLEALRPGLARIDAEIEAGGSRLPLSERVRALLSAPTPGLATAAAALGLIAYLVLPQGPVERDSRNPPSIRTASLPTVLGRPAKETLAPIYDLQGEASVLIFEGDEGSTVIWILDDGDDLSERPRLDPGWS